MLHTSKCSFLGQSMPEYKHTFLYYLGQQIIMVSGGLTLENGRFSAVRPSMEAKAYSEARSSLFRFFFFSFYVSYFFSFSNKGIQTCQVHLAVSGIFPHLFYLLGQFASTTSFKKQLLTKKLSVLKNNSLIQGRYFIFFFQ